MGLHSTSIRPLPNANQRMREKPGQKCQPCQSKGRGHLRNDAALAVVQVLELGTEEIRNQLNGIEYGRNQGQACDGNLIFPVKSQEQQRCKVGHNGLRHKAQITGQLGLPIFIHVFHTLTLICKNGGIPSLRSGIPGWGTFEGRRPEAPSGACREGGAMRRPEGTDRSEVEVVCSLGDRREASRGIRDKIPEPTRKEPAKQTL